jgi:hypothetical protein
MVLLTSGTEKLLLEVLRTLSYVRSRPVEIVVGAGPEQAEKMPCD